MNQLDTRRFLRFLPSLVFLVILLNAELQGKIDLNHNGVSDLWELTHPTLPPDQTDSDSDGFGNAVEAIFGTDATDRLSFPSLVVETHAMNELVPLGQVQFSWRAAPWKRFRIQKLTSGGNTSHTWTDVFVFDSSNSEEIKTFTETLQDGGIFRLFAADRDADADGLSAEEEALLGYSDEDSNSSQQLGMSDFVAAVRELESPAGTVLSNGRTAARLIPSEAAAARFLVESSFGVTEESIAAVINSGFSGWIEDQRSMQATRSRTAMFQNGLSFTSDLARQGIWRMHLIAPDQLRQRMAYALSQIFVVSTLGSSVIGDNALTHAAYYDIFVDEAFNSYRNSLERVTYSPVMGFYLSHLNNRKSDPALSRFPDENYAREIMQLFTIGLWELEPDGSPTVDSDGALIPTYDNETITEMAKVFTGMSHTRRENGQMAISFFDGARGNDYQFPMRVWDEEHEAGEKDIIGPEVLDGTQTGEEEVQATIDALMRHPNIAPFVCRLLIQRFTSSNPSAAYILRVAEAWRATGGPEDQGEANLGRVIEAILLDPEVRNPASLETVRGKVREPYLRHTHLFRAFDFKRADGKYIANVGGLIDGIGQFPTGAPSVFNFYQPDYQPPGEIQTEGLVSPELQLFTTTQILASHNVARISIDSGNVGSVGDFGKELALLPDVDALLDRLDLILTGGRLSVNSRSFIKTAVLAESPDDSLRRVRTAIYLMTQSPSFSVIRP